MLGCLQKNNPSLFFSKTMTTPTLQQIVALAIAEDIGGIGGAGGGDHTSLACISPEAQGRVRLLVKQPCILAGMEAARCVFAQIDPNVRFEALAADGNPMPAGSTAFEAQGRILSLLQAERTALNFMQRLCGIATQTARCAKELQGLHTQVTDTRKTTPALRALEKEAVRLGGGCSHRMGLYDMILIKDNHIDFAGGIEQALGRARRYIEDTGKNLPIEIEARTPADVQTIVRLGGVQRIMFDNFDLPNTQRAVNIVGGRCQTESSGGITLQNLRQYAECGVDYISVGALTHHIQSIDLSLKAV